MALITPVTLAADASASEGDDAVFKLDIPYGSENEAYRWSYKTVNGTATSDADYTSTSGTVTFSSDNRVQYIKVKTKLDCNTQERTETFTLKFSGFQIKNSSSRDNWVTPSWQFDDSNWGATFTREGEIKDRQNMTLAQRNNAGCS